ncbi:acetyltransferase [Acidovorax sp. NCPPB 3859]|nr:MULTISPECIES: GNAT family N-acetyltransferase [unclassified Acidovorax]MDA8452378.1 acetyltransferase [Acidovorax sp. GBBC 3297]MDA8461771.1 acetyltransferase [Acidovorax sp. GBBC 3333]MDA8466804.1 acetyltransferase [Acidovorax sp. GBBC 3332]MDA8471855.1 acetyltransferase [Acidovorax sp. GBBC 3299]WCM77627.1 acetyltransferase [Acidovorax sp. GBBC 712]
MKFATPHTPSASPSASPIASSSPSAAPSSAPAGVPAAATAGRPFLSYAGGQAHAVRIDGASLQVEGGPAEPASRWTLSGHDGSDLALGPAAEGGGPAPAAHLLAALDGAFAAHPERRDIAMQHVDPQALAALAEAGVVLPAADGTWRACRDTLWQQPGLWRPVVPPPMAQRFALTEGRYHPRRAPKPRGLLYQRYIPWLERTFTFRSLDIDEDLPRFNRWMNDPDVAVIWEEEGDLQKHRAYLKGIARDPHMHSMIASLDGEPFAYFEAYWTKESRIAPFYDAHDYDRGWHVLVGEPAFRGKAFATAWLTSISHYLFLCDARTQRILGEPRIDHHQQIRNLDKSGYAKVKEFDLPHKRAQLVMLLREHYFYDGLWMPRT